MKSSDMTVKRVISIVLSVLIASSLMTGCVYEKIYNSITGGSSNKLSEKSDEELIQNRINTFLDAYNSGDLETVLNCINAKNRNAYKAAFSIGDKLIGKTIGINILISDLFSLGISTMSDDDVLTVSELNINISSEKYATVDVLLKFIEGNQEYNDEAYFSMVKENNDWYIKDLAPKQPEIN